MVRIDERDDALTLVTRLARPRVLIVLAALLVVPATLAGRQHLALALTLAGAALALVVLGGRATRTRLAAGRVIVRPAVPLGRSASRALDEFVAAGVETVGEARVRRAEERARTFAARSGVVAPPSWLQGPTGPGANDHLRRLVLVARAGEPLPLTAWLAPEDDLEPARRAVEARLRWGGHHLA